MSGLLGSLLVVVPILIVGVVILLVVMHYRRSRHDESSATFASFVGENLAPPHFSTDVPGRSEKPQGSDSAPGDSRP